MANLRYCRERKKWRVRYRATNRITHKVFSGSRHFLEKSQAIQFYAEMEAQEKAFRSGEVVAIESIENAANQFGRFCRRFTDRTQGHYLYVLKSFLGSLPHNVVRIQQLSSQQIQQYLYALRDLRRTNRTSNAHLTVIKSFAKFCAESYSIPNFAASVTMLHEDPPKVRFLTEREYQLITEAASPIQRDRLVFLAHTGLRAGEFARLAPDSINPQASAITVIGKGRKRRTIPLNATAREIWPRLKPASARALNLACRRLAKKLNLPVFGPHAFRHYFATQLLLKGVPIIKVSYLLGHASISTTQKHYAHILTADLAGATDILSS
jgi:site-specific recombinase XerD